MNKQYQSFLNFAMLAGLINFFIPLILAVDPNCDYNQDLTMGQQYYIYNPQYPATYPPGSSCRWIAQSPLNTRIVFSCENIEIPATANCQGNALVVALNGDVNYTGAPTYCGRGSMSVISDSNRMVIGLYSSYSNPGGRFLCTVSAVRPNEIPTTSTARPATCDCGWKQDRRIVGGIETGINEYPAMAALIDLPKRDLYCGASIISERYALTAAHCVIGRYAKSLGLLAGDHDISKGSDTAAASLYVIDIYKSHPQYNVNTMQNDIAVVRTQLPIAFSIGVGPICLPFRYSQANFVGVTVTALGWGTIEYTGPKSDTLQEVNLTVLSNGECSNSVSPLAPTQMCTYAANKDACQSDSGGPLYVFDTNTNRLMQVGIISYGLGCATNIPGINTRITSFLAWIVSCTSDADYCIK